jgi:tRNA(Arg) A34 adenosine deaminase TadA
MRGMRFPAILIALPEWIEDRIAIQYLPSVEDRMEMILDLAFENINHGGGPFAAGVFDAETHQLIAPGVNMVVNANCSVLHAEIVAIMIAQRIIGSYTLSIQQGRKFELVTSTEPCAMCLGAIPWSGLTSIVCGARDEDARGIGFDEGVKPVNWVEAFGLSGISVQRDVCRKRAQEVLSNYRLRGAPVYNGRELPGETNRSP